MRKKKKKRPRSHTAPHKVIYQVDLGGPVAVLLRGRLTNMVECFCGGCGTSRGRRSSS